MTAHSTHRCVVTGWTLGL